MKAKSVRRQFLLLQAAKLIGVAPITLRRWLRAGKVKEVARNRNGWRVFTRKEIIQIRKFATQIRPPFHK
jgi:predicted site-specific integrase-resolvase